jgi:DNA-binding NarL/FixJ family response regulator
MDMRMPGMDGIEVLNAILGKDRQASIIINTAFPQYREKFMTWEAEAFVIKSSDLSELKQKVRQVLDKRQAARVSQKTTGESWSISFPANKPFSLVPGWISTAGRQGREMALPFLRHISGSNWQFWK